MGDEKDMSDFILNTNRWYFELLKIVFGCLQPTIQFTLFTIVSSSFTRPMVPTDWSWFQENHKADAFR